ncbi:hypothetical protein CBR_g37167 [Chara braunii]|uniref:Reverse transcriptase domain-containing protein n=1 Tax=Chara braunii TaxID=69332 RepID=A0A388LMK3_CHABU|nr:hypothetical protein CBR_g37167 [Chara braunii]|eukprot:GBG83455.1 hypothetical protein CBR_g37167 [Chara braunii]
MDGNIYDQFGEAIDRRLGGVRAEAQRRAAAGPPPPAMFRLWQEKEEPPIGVEEVGSDEEVTQGLRGESETEEAIIESDDEDEEERTEPPSVLFEKMEDLLDKMGRGRLKQGSQRRYKTVDKKCHPVPVLVTVDEEAYYERERGLIRRIRESALAGPCRINEGNEKELIIGESDFLLPQERTLMVELMKRKHRAYAFSNEERGRLDVDKIPMIRIYTMPHEPWNMMEARYPNPDEERKVVDYLDGKIRTHVADYSTEPYSSPWFCFIKPNGTLRWVQDLQRLNAVTVRDAGGLPNADALSESCVGRPIISLIDLYSGYDQFPVYPPERPVTAMHAPRGLIHMNVAAQGWTNAVAMVQRAMIQAMQSVSPHITQPYIDDLAVKGLAMKESDEVSPGVRHFVWKHIQDLEKVVSLLEEHNLTASGAKSRHCMREATILEIVCNEKGRRPDVKKTDKITEWPVSFHSITDVRSFLVEGVPREEVPQEEVPREEVPREEVPREEVPREEVPREEAQGTQRESRLGDGGRRAGKEVIEVGEDTPPQTPAVGLRFGDTPGSTRQAEERLQREEAPFPSSERAPSREGRAGRRRERAVVRREALTLIDRHLAAYALEHPNLEEPAPAEPRQEPYQPEKEIEAEIPKRVDLRTRERAPAGATTEEKRARRTRRIDEIWQERQRLEAAGEFPEQQQMRQRSEAAGALPGPCQEPPMGRVILEPEEARAQRQAEKEAFEFRAPTKLATLPVAAAGPVVPLAIEEGLPPSSSEPAQGSEEGSMGVLLEAVHTMQKEASLFSPEQRIEEPLEREMGIKAEGAIESRLQRMGTPEDQRRLRSSPR